MRYLAHELGTRRIRVNAISAGRCARGSVRHRIFDELVAEAERRAPERRIVIVTGGGRMALVLASDLAGRTRADHPRGRGISRREDGVSLTGGMRDGHGYAMARTELALGGHGVVTGLYLLKRRGATCTV